MCVRASYSIRKCRPDRPFHACRPTLFQRDDPMTAFDRSYSKSHSTIRTGHPILFDPLCDIPAAHLLSVRIMRHDVDGSDDGDQAMIVVVMHAEARARSEDYFEKLPKKK